MKTVARMLDKVSRLYEQGADEFRIEMYVRRWWLWVKGGVQGKVDFLGCDRICVREVKNLIDRFPIGAMAFMSQLRRFHKITRWVCWHQRFAPLLSQ